MAVDYLKTYLGIDPNDYSAMEARIRGEEPQARTPVMMRQPMMMPQQRSLGDIEAMQLIPRQQPAPQPAPQVDDRYQGLMDQIAALRSQIEGMQAPTEQAPVGAEAPVMADEPSMMDEQDVFSSWRNSPEKAAYDAKGMMQTAWTIDPRIIQTQSQDKFLNLMTVQELLQIIIKKLMAEI
jgi:hypothetical protein